MAVTVWRCAAQRTQIYASVIYMVEYSHGLPNTWVLRGWWLLAFVLGAVRLQSVVVLIEDVRLFPPAVLASLPFLATPSSSHSPRTSARRSMAGTGTTTSSSSTLASTRSSPFSVCGSTRYTHVHSLSLFPAATTCKRRWSECARAHTVASVHCLDLKVPITDQFERLSQDEAEKLPLSYKSLVHSSTERVATP
jgi:hypothetical protein